VRVRAREARSAEADGVDEGFTPLRGDSWIHYLLSWINWPEVATWEAGVAAGEHAVCGTRGAQSLSGHAALSVRPPGAMELRIDMDLVGPAASRSRHAADALAQPYT
jgi:hypothetical protein